MDRCYLFQSSYTRNKLKNKGMILRGGLFVCYLFNVLLALLFLICPSFAIFSLSFVFTCFLPPPLSLVPSLLAYFPSAFGKSSKERGQNKNQNSCNHTGPSSFSATQAAFGRAPFSAVDPWHGNRLSPQMSCAECKYCSWRRVECSTQAGTARRQGERATVKRRNSRTNFVTGARIWERNCEIVRSKF